MADHWIISIMDHIKRLTRAALSWSLTAIALGLVYTGFIYTASFAWRSFMETPTGKRFSLQSLDLARAIDHFLIQPDLLMHAIHLAGTVALVSLVIAGIAQILALSRFLYFALPWHGRVVWIIAITWFLSPALQDRHQPYDDTVMMLNTLILVAVFLPASMKLCGRLFPDVVQWFVDRYS